MIERPAKPRPRRTRRWRHGPLLLALAAAPAAAQSAAAQSAAEAVQPAIPLPGVVVAATPFPGSGVDAAKSPIAVTVLSDADLIRGGPPDVLRLLDELAPGVSLDSASGNPFQPSLIYRGFQASPLQGTAQGLAVYVGGVRFNQPFGDTVNWDLIPGEAIEQLTLEGSNPVFGLNALGGALNVRLKSGFSYQGAEADLSGGSFGQIQGDVQSGAKLGDAAVYLAATVLHQEGWRDLQSSDIRNLYGDVGWRGGGGEVHLDLRLAQSELNGPGAAPVQLLAADPAAQFTGPNRINNGYAAVSLAGRTAVSDATTLQAIAYGDDFRQTVANGNAPNDVPCADRPALLCADAGPSTTLGGAAIAAFLGPDPFAYAELDQQTTGTVGYGLAGQVEQTGRLLGWSNRVTAGLSFDGAQTGFTGVSLIGGLTPTGRTFIGPGVIIDEPGVNSPVRLSVSDAAFGAFAADTLDLSERLSATLSGRFGADRIDLADRNGGDLSGAHRFSRFNPALGATYRAASWITAYAGYAEANRAPTPAELSCASPVDACSLANFFVGDPNLKQVVAHTFEAGLRGQLGKAKDAALSYSLGLYRSDLDDDIAFVNGTALGRAYFANIGRTRRQGLDASLRLQTPRWLAWLDYSHTEATFRGGFIEAGGENPAASPDGTLAIRPGDRLPGVPTNHVKLGVTFKATERLALGAAAVGQDGVYLFGDEANLTARLPGYAVLNLNADYQLTPHLQLFVRVENATDARYATYGTFSPTAAVRLVQAPGASDPRSISPAAPIGGFGGVRASF